VAGQEKLTGKDGILDIHKRINNRFQLSENTCLILRILLDKGALFLLLEGDDEWEGSSGSPLLSG
jgi:hypothetical protein